MNRLSLVLAALLLLALAACNPKEKTGGTTQTGSDSNSTASQSGDGAGAGFTVKIGFNFEETGNTASFGQSSHKGAEMALEELAGMPDMPKFEAAWEDNASDSTQSATVASKLINEDKVNVLIGCVASSNSIAMAKIAEEAGIPMISPASTKTTLTLMEDKSTVRPLIFRTCFIDDFQGKAMLDFCVKHLSAKKIALLVDDDQDYSIGIGDTIRAEAAGMGVSIVAEDKYLSSSETDFRTKLNRMKGAGFDVLIVPGYYDKVAQIANQARELGITQPLVGGDGWDSPDLWKNAGKNIEGSFFTNHYAADDQDPAVQGFIAKYKAKNGGQTPDAMSILAYDCVMAVADAYKRAGSNDPTAFSEAMAATSGFQGASGTINIDEHHNASKKLVVVEVTPGGAYKWVYTFDPSGAASAPPADGSASGDMQPSSAAGARFSGGAAAGGAEGGTEGDGSAEGGEDSGSEGGN
ncbi:ABC transporter substrate-binding protein [bacterium]|nr:ABC transporter substrate-binding protein [bacterium]